MPVAPNCTASTRETLLANSATGGADSAGETAAALAATAVLLQDEDFSYALRCLATAHALMEFATTHPVCTRLLRLPLCLRFVLRAPRLWMRHIEPMVTRLVVVGYSGELPPPALDTHIVAVFS